MDFFMKGAIFAGFEEFVINKFDLVIWQKILDCLSTTEEKIFLSTSIYDDQEFLDLVSCTEKITGLTSVVLQRDFGLFIFPALYQQMHNKVSAIKTLFEFLKAVDEVIHVEVKKADPAAYTPTMLFDKPTKEIMLIRYISKRKMCHFAEGLILGAAEFYNEDVIVSQDTCSHLGDAECIIRIQK